MLCPVPAKIAPAFAIRRATGVHQARRQTVGVSKSLLHSTVYPVPPKIAPAFAIRRATGVHQARRQTVGVSKSLLHSTVHPVHKKKPPKYGGKERVSSCSRVLLTEHEMEHV